VQGGGWSDHVKLRKSSRHLKVISQHLHQLLQPDAASTQSDKGRQQNQPLLQSQGGQQMKKPQIRPHREATDDKRFFLPTRENQGLEI